MLPNVAETLQAAVTRHQAGQLEAAASLYRDVLTASPENADALHLLGVVAHQRGDHVQAVRHITAAIAVDASVADFHLNLGSAQQALGRLDEAICSFERSLQLSARSPIAHNNLGNAFKASGRLDDALAQYRLALQLAPDYAEAYCNLGVAQIELGNLDAARASLRHALQINPHLVEAHSNLGIVEERLGSADAAIAAYCEALARDPSRAEAWSNLGHLLRDQGNVAEARDAYAQVAQRRSGPLWTLRTALPCPVIPQSNDEIDEFRARFEAAVDACRGKQLCADPEELTRFGCEPSFYLPYQGRNDRLLKSAYARLFVDNFPDEALPARDGIVHVAFVVSDRREAVFVRFLRGILQRLPSTDLKVSVVCSAGGRPLLARAIADERVEYLTIPSRLTQAAATLRAAAIDVLFYFEIGTDSLGYFLPFCRSAPVQVTSWGVPVTSGIPSVDYYLSSELLEPAGAEDHYSEQLVRFRTLPACYDRPRPLQRQIVRGAYGLAPQDHLYLCPQSPFKLHPDFDEAIAGVLRADPQGKMVLLEGKHRRWTQLLSQRFARSIPDVMERIAFLPPQSHENFVGLLECCDVMLDPYHFGGGATTYEALAVGTPIVTLPAAHMRGRVTAACYQKMGLADDCLATSAEEYVARAVRLGTDADFREAVRSRIRSTNETLFDDAGAVEELREFIHTIAGQTRAASGGHHADHSADR